MEATKKKIMPIAFCKCVKTITNIQNGPNKGNPFTYYKGKMNINGVWYTIMNKYTKTGDLMLEIYGKNESN